MSDLIDRNAVMLRVREFIGNPTYNENMLVNDINALPSAEPERKKGKWIYDTERVMGDGWTYNQYHCSECGQQIIGAVRNFCPYCGADMKGE